MNEDKNIKLIQDAYAAFGHGDIPAVLAIIDAKAEWTLPGEGHLPQAGTYRGPEGVGNFFKKLSETAEITRFEPSEFFAKGDRVVVLGFYAGTSKPIGKPFQSEWVHAFTVRGGKVTSLREHSDTAVGAEAYR